MPLALRPLALIAIAAGTLGLAACAGLDPTPSYEDTYDRSVSRELRPETNPEGLAYFRDVLGGRTLVGLESDHAACGESARVEASDLSTQVSGQLRIDQRRFETADGRPPADKSIYISCMKQKGWDLAVPGGLATTAVTLPDVTIYRGADS